MAVAAAGFVDLARADENDRVVVFGRRAVDEALCARGRRAADDADGGQLVHLFRLREEERHRTEWLAAEIQIQPGDQDAYAAIGKHVDHPRDLGVKELRFVDGDDRGGGVQLLEDLLGALDRHGAPVVAVVRGELIGAIARIELVGKDLDALLGNFGAPQAANQFFRLAGKHGPANQLDVPAGTFAFTRSVVHRPLPVEYVD